MSKIIVGILCGGRSSEHEISCMSAGGILSALDRDKYEPILIGITRTAGRWVVLPADFPLHIVDGRLPSVPEDAPEINTDLQGFSLGGTPLKIDLIFPALHGAYGEDGAIQGFCEIANIAYVGSGILSSALAMDKSVAKSIFAAHGMRVAEGIAITAHNWEYNRVASQSLLTALSYPLFVKPARGGSSRGTSKVHSDQQLSEALTQAHRFDEKAIVEEAIVGRELECALLEVGDELITSPPGEIIIDSKFEFYDFQAKYLDGATSIMIPAEIPAAASAEIQRQAGVAFRALGCSGLARVDFFYRPDGEITIIELNTMPGFTATSGFPSLMSACGITFPRVIDELIKCALTRKNSVLGQ